MISYAMDKIRGSMTVRKTSVFPEPGERVAVIYV